ncbi:MAG TPA: wax ester/triacylglycerol synthase family O-acyltransferase [Acidimicrobiia bacterium]|jgi:WS/DGAT/MGAT family acyltransferase|nr:wax ester/triacylglycerol synthase family O-acyltransferase [Acidimicrobiia bacterium]
MAGHYERLSYLDASFFALESRSTHMHVAALTVFEAGALQTEDGGIDSARIRRFVESRLHLMPRYRQRLAYVPFEQAPVWVDDEYFNIDYHVRHTSLPRPGDREELLALMGRLASQQLDRSKPLWEMWVVEGLAEDRFALISKTHHSMIDGISGVDLMTVLLNLMPVSEVDEPPPYEPRPAPNGTELVVRETARRVGSALNTMRSVRRMRGEAQSIAMGGVRRVRAMGYSLSSGWLTPASKTPVNGTVGPNRRFGTLELPLADVKKVKNALGGSVNDVVLATVAGAMQRYFDETDGVSLPDDFRVMAPVSVRTADQRGTLGNQVAMWLVSLPVAEPDPVKRLELVIEETDRLKRTDQALGAASLVRLSAGAPITLVSLASRLAANARPFNMTVTNVPGPQFPLYLLEAKLLSTYPLVPLWSGHGAGIALFSYDGTLFWGLNADWDVVPDVDVLATAIAASFAELVDASEGRAPKRAKKKAPKKRPPMGAAPKQADVDASTSA